MDLPDICRLFPALVASGRGGSGKAGKLPKDKVAIFVCGSGARGMEAVIKLKEGKQDASKAMYFDANVKCDAKNVCEIKVNEPLG